MSSQTDRLTNTTYRVGSISTLFPTSLADVARKDRRHQ